MITSLKKQSNSIWVISLLLIVLQSCNVTQDLSVNDRLLTGSKISIEGNVSQKRKIAEDLKDLIYQKPNKKMFGLFPVRLALYNKANKKKENKLRWWLKNKVGEPPVIYSSKLTANSVQNLNSYLFGKGYLNVRVEYEEITKDKKTKVEYRIYPNEQYMIDSIFLPKGESPILAHIKQEQKNSLIQPGTPFNTGVLNEERKRLSESLRNEGYFYFNKDYITYEIDSNAQDKTLTLYLKVGKSREEYEKHKYTINNIYIHTNYSITSITDSILLDTIQSQEYYFIFSGDKMQYKEGLLKNGIYFKKGDVFQLSNYQKTVRKLSNYGTFKFVNIDFVDTYIRDSTNRSLDVIVYLTPSKKQSMSIDAEASHSFEGLSGTAISYTYRNRNLSGGADLLQLRISSGIELQFGKDVNLLNNADVVTELSYYINRFLLPFPLKKAAKNSSIKTKLSLQYNYEKRIQFYSLHSLNASIGYEWSMNKANRIKSHTYNPIFVNLFIIPEESKTQEFEDRLDDIPTLKRSFEEQIIPGSNYTFYYSNQSGEEDRSYLYFRGDVRLSGNLVHGVASLINKNQGDTLPYTLFKREYSQFSRFEVDLRYYYHLGRHATLATRINTGIIVPYGNSSVAPYFQQFYAGGPNSVRSFRFRALGPGTYADTVNIDNPNFFFDQSGDIKLEVNAELRFDIFKWFKGALFADAGNIWLLKEDTERPGGQFKIDTWHKSIAIGAGAGLRMDFNYFVIRFDMAFPVRDPRLEPDKRWAIKDFDIGSKSWRQQNLIFNLAIGYPF